MESRPSRSTRSLHQRPQQWMQERVSPRQQWLDALLSLPIALRGDEVLTRVSAEQSVQVLAKPDLTEQVLIEAHLHRRHRYLVFADDDRFVLLLCIRRLGWIVQCERQAIGR